ncbi:uncharacterized protein L201_003738 [Kwoniella dendrophila CBS 6074]|uniref:Uncharacterized protein n=1 Tax=Kwoniella dendrophila CBS 6074 TaxID=1295534 RepID=A0AAX4JTS2_9TREE
MTTIYGSTQLEPFEEIQSPSPNETTENPYETTLAARRSLSQKKRTGSGGPPSPINTVNTLHRQLSGDPESPPPAWKRRPSVNTRQQPRSPTSSNTHSPTYAQSPTSINGDSFTSRSPIRSQNHNQRSPSQSSVNSRNSAHSPTSIRRPPTGLTMTSSAVASPRSAVPLANGMFLHESPNSSSTNLADVDLALPNPAFRRRAMGNSSPSSNRSPISSSQDLSKLTSEDLWSLGQEQDNIPDMSNPSRQAAERPLDTVRRESRRIEKGQTFHVGGLPGDVIWPTAPPPEEILRSSNSIKSKSFTNVATLGMSGRRMSRRAKSRQSSIDVGAMNAKEVDGLYMHNSSHPSSPAVNGMGALSSAHSSSTSLASQGLPPNKSFSSGGGRPPSTYYSRDFLSSLAPREGGYAIAATMGGGLGAVGTMSVEEKRRSTVYDDGRSRTVGSRAPPSKSAGMGRWSLDGGENFGRPYATPSAATTSSNLSAPPINSAEPSPPAEEITPSLPAGASPAYNPSTSSGPSVPLSTTPPNPSPLAQQTSVNDAPSSNTATRHPPPPPIPASDVAPLPALNTKKSKKQLAKENKAAEKAEAIKVSRQRAEAARAEALKKQAEREDAKRKKEEEKAKKKAEKKAAKKGKKVLGLSTSSTTASGSSTPQPAKPNPPIAAQHTPSTSSAPTPTPAKSAVPPPTLLSAAKPFPQSPQPSQDTQRTPIRSTSEAPRPTHKSMPLNATAPSSQQRSVSQTATERPSIEPKRSFFGTIRKRLSYIGSSESKGSQSKESAPPVPKIPSTLPASPIVQQKIQPEISNNHTSASSTSIATGLPPRVESLAASVSSPKVSSPTSPKEASVPDTPTKNAVSPTIQQSPQPQTPLNLNLGKTISRDGGVSSSPPPSSISSGTRKRNSLHGPRPMPNANQSRPSSIVTHESSSVTGEQHQQPTNISSLSFNNQNNQQQSQQTNSSYGGSESQQSGGGPVTPSTTGDSNSFFLQSHNSHMTNITPITSPEDNDSFNNEEVNVGFSKLGVDDNEPKRENSGDSNETVHITNTNNGVSVNHNQPILA